MPTQKRARPAHESNSESLGLLANGSSGQWDVAIDETTSGTDRWFAQIEGAAVSFYFEIPSPDIVPKMLQFLEQHLGPVKGPPATSPERNGSLVLGKDKKTPVILVKDDEYADRYFLVIGRMESPTVRFVIAGMDVLKIADALRQVTEDLGGDE